MQSLISKLKFLYPNEVENVNRQLLDIIKIFKNKKIKINNKDQVLFSEKNAILICYADHVQESGVKTFRTMHKFLSEYASDLFSHIHFLPFYTWSSDDGFSVKDYYKVYEPYGDWEDLRLIAKNFKFIFDCVANHMSVQGEWFERFKSGDEKYKKYFIAFNKNELPDITKVFRPRATPLFTEFETKEGAKMVWTTFSEDQADLNFSNPEVFLEMIKVLFFYIENGATAIRLDAIAYIWKKAGTSSFDLEEVHILVKIIKQVIEKVAPHVWIITETVLPHKENINYFGNGQDESQLVYHFQLETLLLYTMLKGDTSVVANWLKNIKYPSNNVSYLNLSVSHDGIHTIPAKGILSDKQMKAIGKDCESKGGKVLLRDVGGGKTEIYEMNITYPSAIGPVDKYLASQAILLALRGIPLVYFNNLIGADNYLEGVEELGYSRAINRQKFDYNKLTDELKDKNNRKYQIYQGYRRLLEIRMNEPLFSPTIKQKIVSLDARVMIIKRYDKNKELLAMTNVSNEKVNISAEKISRIFNVRKVKDLLAKKNIDIVKGIKLAPYQTLWLK